MSTVTWIRLQLPDWVHRRLKAKAALKGLTLRDYLTAVLTREVEEEGDDE